MKRTAEDAERTRLALLEAALMAFAEKGWRGATFEHVAARAGVTRGALNHHFRSKSALLEDALGWGWAEYESRVFDGGAGTTGHSAIEALLAEYVTLLREDALFRALAASTVLVAPQAFGDTAGSPAKSAALDDWRDRIATALGSTPEAEAPEPASLEPAPRSVADLVLVLLHGFTVTAVTRPESLPHPHEIGASITALARGLSGWKGPP